MGYINKKGEEICAPKYDEARDFKGKMAAVCQDDKWGFIDEKGTEIVELKFDEVYDFDENPFTLGIIDDEEWVVWNNGHTTSYEEFKKQAKKL